MERVGVREAFGEGGSPGARMRGGSNFLLGCCFLRRV
jgi:hypothetical protein